MDYREQLKFLSLAKILIITLTILGIARLFINPSINGTELATTQEIQTLLLYGSAQLIAILLVHKVKPQFIQSLSVQTAIFVFPIIPVYAAIGIQAALLFASIPIALTTILLTRSVIRNKKHSLKRQMHNTDEKEPVSWWDI